MQQVATSTIINFSEFIRGGPTSHILRNPSQQEPLREPTAISRHSLQFILRCPFSIMEVHRGLSSSRHAVHFHENWRKGNHTTDGAVLFSRYNEGRRESLNRYGGFATYLHPTVLFQSLVRVLDQGAWQVVNRTDFYRCRQAQKILARPLGCASRSAQESRTCPTRVHSVDGCEVFAPPFRIPTG